MKACKDCRHCNYVWAGLVYCQRESVSVNVITGSQEYDIAYVVRKDETRCGQEGKWFESLDSPVVEVFTDERTMSVVSKLLVGEPYEVVETGDGFETIGYVRNGSVYELTYIESKLHSVTITPGMFLRF